MSLTRSPRQKLSRANIHLIALNKGIQRFADSKPFQILVEEIVQEGKTRGRAYVNPLRPIPDSFGLIVGDACNNLRAVLDHLLWGLFTEHGISFKGDWVPGFPIFANPSDFAKASVAKQVEKLSGKWPTLIKQAQPYNRGHNLLSVLRELNNFDKHRQVSIVMMFASFESMSMDADVFRITPQSPDPLVTYVAVDQRIEGQTQLFDIPVTDFSDMGRVLKEARFRFYLAFGDTPRTSPKILYWRIFTKVTMKQVMVRKAM